MKRMMAKGVFETYGGRRVVVELMLKQAYANERILREKLADQLAGQTRHCKDPIVKCLQVEMN
jgi:hypothetical protein